MLSPRSPSLQPPIPPTLPSSPFNPSAFSSTLALPFTRPTSASAIHTRKPSARSKRALAMSRKRRTRSAASSTSPSVSASDFSMADFTIDLAKLGEKESGMTMPDGETRPEGIGSEDEGPEDFTLNLEKWMRGDQLWRRGGGGDFDTKYEQKDDDKDSQQVDGRDWTSHGEEEEHEHEINDEKNDRAGQNEDGQEAEVIEIHEHHSDESDFEPLNTSTPAPPMSHKPTTQVDEGFADDGNLQPPPLSRLNTETLQNRAAEEVFDQISALQMEVERLRAADQNSRYLNEMLKRAHVSDQEENGRLKGELQNVTDEVVRLQEEKGAMEKSLDMEKKYREAAGLEVGSLRTKFEPIVQELAVVRSAADAEKKSADEKIAILNTKLVTSQIEIIKEQKDGKALLDAKQDEIKNLILECQHLKSESSGCRQALEAQVLASQKEISKERKDFEALETRIHDQIREVISKIDQYHNDILSYRQALQDREEQAEDHALEITKLTTKVEAAKDLESSLALQKMDLDHAQELLRETRCGAHIVKEEKDRLTKENERHSTENAEIAGLLDRKGTELQAAESTIDKLRDELASPQSEKHAGATGVEAHEPALKELQKQQQTGLQEIKTAHEKELKSLNSTILRANDGMRKREQRFEKAHREELASLRQKIASLEKSKAASNPSVLASAVSADVAKLRDAARILWSQLAAVTATLQGTRLALTESQDALAESRAQTAEVRASEAAALQELEEQFAVAVEAREKEWRRRIGIMFRDREKMSKALLWAWGREEVGEKGQEHEGGKQGYRYRFVER